MADQADIANAQAEVRVAAAISRVDGAIPAGAPGICEDCGEAMPRLVDGLCGFCRDGRRPPLSFYADRPAPALNAPQEETKSMPNPPPSDDFRNVSILARGPLLRAIMDRASERDLSLNKAATSLIEDALVDPTEEATVIIEPASVEKLTTVDLLAELGRRFDAAVTPALLDAAVTRAEAAEGQLAVILAAFDQVRPAR